MDWGKVGSGFFKIKGRRKDLKILLSLTPLHIIFCCLLYKKILVLSRYKSTYLLLLLSILEIIRNFIDYRQLHIKISIILYTVVVFLYFKNGKKGMFNFQYCLHISDLSLPPVKF
jgi:hypothetical protein